MNAKEIIEAAYRKLSEDYDEDPRSALMRGLSALMNADAEVPTGEIELNANVRAGGLFTVSDQHGRPVRGVKAVSMFRDQDGQPVLQVSL
jgi:hypothetical protein